MGYVILLIVIGIFWIIGQVINSIQDITNRGREEKIRKKEFLEKFGDRIVDRNQSLKDRNQDIIDNYLSKIRKAEYRDYYYIDNSVRDCINDIMLAEGENNNTPGDQYLSRWRSSANNEFGKLSDELVRGFKEKQSNLKRIEEEEEIKKQKRVRITEDIELLINLRDSFGGIENEYFSHIETIKQKIQAISTGEDFSYEYNGNTSFSMKELFASKVSNKKLITLDIASNILSGKGIILDLIMLYDDFNYKDDSLNNLNSRKKSILSMIKAIDLTVLTKKENHQLIEITNALELCFFNLEKRLSESINETRMLLNKLQKKRNIMVSELEQGLNENNVESIEKYIQIFISYLKVDPFFQEVVLEYKSDEEILIINYKYVDLDNFPNLKEEKIYKDGTQKDIQLSQKAYEDAYDQYITAVCIRTMYELFKKLDRLLLISFNGWVHTINKGTGNEENLFIMSIQSKREECLNLNLVNIDPKVAFRGLKGISASKLSSLTPINPILNINTEDHRFVEGYNVVEGVNSKTNLAVMDWQDFENLIRELFGKEFGINGGEVKITQASRDGGVDAIAFDPDPYRGGKIVIQAKRYNNTVGVSAVRDLYGTVMNEGANKGILITTATFGPDAYAFVKNKPLTLIDGSGLLYLLEKHGYSAKIDLREAKKILNLKQK